MSSVSPASSPEADLVRAVDFTLIGKFANYEKQVQSVAEYLNLGGWVAIAASGNLIGRAMGRSKDVCDFKNWLCYVAPGYALTQETKYVENVRTRISDLDGFHVM